MASFADEGRALLYCQQIKREHQYFKKLGEQFAASLTKVNLVYDMTQKHEVRMNDIDAKLTQLAEDTAALKTCHNTADPESHAWVERSQTVLQDLSHRLMRLEALEKEHGSRARSNGTLLRDIQIRLTQLEHAVEALPKSMGKATRRPHDPELAGIVDKLAAMQTMLHHHQQALVSQERNVQRERDPIRLAADMATRTSPRSGECDLGPGPSRQRRSSSSKVQSSTPTRSAMNTPARRRQAMHSARLSRRHIIFSPRAPRKSTTIIAPIPPSSRARPHSPLNTCAHSPSIVRELNYGSSPAPRRAPLRRSIRLGAKKGKAPSQLNTPVRCRGDAKPLKPLEQNPVMLRMNQSYPEVPGLQQPTDTARAAAPGPDEAQLRRPGALIPHPRRRKKRELPPMNPLPPYED